MAKPTVITVVAGAGIGTQPAPQIPLVEGNAVTLINLDDSSGGLAVVLCNDSDFNPSTTWPLGQLQVMPQPDINNLWVQNPNDYPVNLLVLKGIVPVSQFFPNGAP